MHSILSVPISLPISPGQLSLDNDLDITGQLTVRDLVVTNFSSLGINTYTPDPIITVNKTAPYNASLFAGLTVNRGVSGEAPYHLQFDESVDEFRIKREGDAWQSIMTRSTTVSAGYIPFGNAANGYTHDGSNLFWDDTNNRLGIGTNAPANPLDVVGIASFSKEVLIGKTNAEGYLVDIKGTATIPASVLRLDGYGATNSTSSMLMRSRDGSGTIKENTITCSSANGGTFAIKDNTTTSRIAFNPNRLYLDFKKTGDQSLMDLYDSTLASGEYVRRRLGSGNSGGGSGNSITETFYYSSTPTSSRGVLHIEGYETNGVTFNSIGVGVGGTPTTKLHIKESSASTNCTATIDALDNNSLARLGFARAGTEQGAIEYKVDSTTATQEMRLKTNNTTRITIEGDGEVGIGVAPAAGYKLNVSGPVKTDGIAFPASQVASADANTLDDYEENNFVPALAFLSGQSGSFTYSAQTGSYTKIGREVFCNINIVYSAKPSAGTQLEITGLPFTCGESTTTGGIVEWSTVGSWTTSSPTVGYIGASGTKIILGRSSTTDTATYNQADIPSLAEFYLRFSYRV